MITAEQFTAAGIPLSGSDAISVLYAEAALDWMQEHTILEFDKSSAESVSALPSCAKLFVVKFCESMRHTAGVTSQSIEGLSMSFDASESTESTIWALANTLLNGYIKSRVQVFPARRRW